MYLQRYAIYLIKNIFIENYFYKLMATTVHHCTTIKRVQFRDFGNQKKPFRINPSNAK